MEDTESEYPEDIIEIDETTVRKLIRIRKTATAFLTAAGILILIQLLCTFSIIPGTGLEHRLMILAAGCVFLAVSGIIYGAGYSKAKKEGCNMETFLNLS